MDALSAIWKAPPQGWSQREIDAYLQRARRAYFYVSDVNVELKKQFRAVWKEFWRGPEDYCDSD